MSSTLVLLPLLLLLLLWWWFWHTRVVICGAGIMGAATAYYLAQLGVAATLVEREAVACAASGGGTCGTCCS
jgi:ribulose 1,5-bisphosphate synthetase/thiazole synthase